MTHPLLTTALLTILFSSLDLSLNKFNLNGRYYLIHSLHNAVIVCLTVPDIVNTITDFSNLTSYPVNYTAAQFCFALHIYHILLYFRTLRYDDWLHHILMIGCALPLGCILESHTLLGFSLFFTTGLPGGIDYFLLFLTRNYWLNKMTEKKINTFLNVWIRSPGCIAQAVLTLVWVFSYNSVTYPLFSLSPTLLGSILVSLLNYWNGQYFMEQVVTDFAKKDIRLIGNETV